MPRFACLLLIVFAARSAADEFYVMPYDRDGRQVEAFEVPAVKRDGKSWAEARLPEGYAAAIVRK